MVDFASQNVTVIKVLAGIVGGLAAAILAANVALKAYEAVQILVKAATVAWTAVQWLLNAALNANPIGLVTIAIAGLVAGIVIAYNKSETFRDVVQAALKVVRIAVDALADAFTAAMAAARAAFDWIIGHWKIALFAFGPIGIAVSLIASNFDAIKSAASTAWGYVSSAWNVGRFAFGAIADAVGAVASAFDRITGAVNSAIGAVESLIGWLGRIHVPSINLPHIPGFNLAPAPPALPGPSAGTRGAGAPAAAAGGLTINVYGAVDVEGTARAIRRVLVNHDRRQGRLA
jgi:phage-related protein